MALFVTTGKSWVLCWPLNTPEQKAQHNPPTKKIKTLSGGEIGKIFCPTAVPGSLNQSISDMRRARRRAMHGTSSCALRRPSYTPRSVPQCMPSSSAPTGCAARTTPLRSLGSDAWHVSCDTRRPGVMGLPTFWTLCLTDNPPTGMETNILGIQLGTRRFRRGTRALTSRAGDGLPAIEGAREATLHLCLAARHARLASASAARAAATRRRSASAVAAVPWTRMSVSS